MESKVGFVIVASRRSVIQLVPRWCKSVERHIGVVKFAVNDGTDGKGRPSLQETMVRTHQRFANNSKKNIIYIYTYTYIHEYFYSFIFIHLYLLNNYGRGGEGVGVWVSGCCDPGDGMRVMMSG